MQLLITICVVVLTLSSISIVTSGGFIEHQMAEKKNIICIISDKVNDHSVSSRHGFFISDQLVTFLASICMGIGELDINWLVKRKKNQLAEAVL